MVNDGYFCILNLNFSHFTEDVSLDSIAKIILIQQIMDKEKNYLKLKAYA